MDSREKVLGLRQRLRELRPPDEEAAQMMQFLTVLWPLFVKAIPEDPAELDRYLRMGAWGMAQCRSDDAAPLGLFEWDGEQWQPVDVGAEA